VPDGVDAEDERRLRHPDSTGFRALGEAWKDLGRVQKYVLIQGQVLMWVVILVVTYLFATRLSVALAIAYLLAMLVLEGWMIRRIRRETPP
jgi:hypothetical protein